MIPRTVSTLAFVLLSASVLFAGQPLNVSFHSYTNSADFTAPGSVFEGTRLSKSGGAITYASAIGTAQYTDPFGYGTRAYSYARWTSPWFNTGINFSELRSEEHT